MTIKGFLHIMRLQSSLFVPMILPLLTCSYAHAQFRGEWVTAGNDAQRSGWVRTDAKINPESMVKPGFEFLWKMKFANTPRQANSLTAPVLMNQLIGYRGFRALAFVGGSADKVFVVDTDLARMEWQNTLPSGPEAPATPECPGGLTSALARGTSAAIAPVVAGAGVGRGSAASSAVGNPGEGAVTLAAALQRQRPAVPVPPPAPGGVKPAPAPQGRRADGPVYAISSSGMLHFLNVHNGADVEPPVKFLPPNANASGLIAVDRRVYAVTSSNCGAATSGVWAMDLDTKQVSRWESKAPVAGSAGVALGGDGSVYVATRSGEMAHLEAGTLKPLGSYSAAGQEFTSSPVVFDHKGRILVAAATRDGQLHLVDGSAMSRAMDSPAKAAALGALASWQDETGVRWLLASSAKGVIAWKVTDRVEPGWTSPEIAAPLAPMIVNGVVFAVSSGKAAPAVLYALDGRSGKALWNSGKTIASPVQGGGLAGAVGQVYVPAYDGTLYAFGFPIEH